MNPWKACDIRGIYPHEVSIQFMRGFGRTVASRIPLGTGVVVAGDFRLSTPALKEALIDGLLGSGAHVLDAGRIPTPVAYFAKRLLGASVVLIVTASHNPPNYNGLKLMLGDLPPTPSDLEELSQSILEETPIRNCRGVLEHVDMLPDYEEWQAGLWGHLTRGARIKVVLDAGNGVWSEIAPRIFRKLGFAIHPLYCEIDGSFPNRSPNCASAGSLKSLQREVTMCQATLGIAWDGDGDRVAFVDECGVVVSTDEISALLARHALAREPMAKVVYDLKLSELVRHSILRWGGCPVMERSGHAFIKRRMIQDNCLFGCEASGHYFFRELRGGDDGLFAALLMTELISEWGSLASVRRSLDPFFATPDLRLPVSNLSFSEVQTRFRELFRPARENTIDGLRLEVPEGFILTRESITEPVISIRIEGRSERDLKALVEKCLRALPEDAEEITKQISLTRNT